MGLHQNGVICVGSVYSLSKWYLMVFGGVYDVGQVSRDTRPEG